MNLWQRFKRLTFWNKLCAFGAVCSILGLGAWLVFRDWGTKADVDVDRSPNAKVQTAVGSPGATQIIADQVTVRVSPKLQRTLTMETVYVNKSQGGRYVTLLRGKLKAPYPVPNLRVEAHGETVEKIEFTGTRVYALSDRGKYEGYVFATWQDAIGNLELKIVSSQPGELHVRFAVQE